MLAIALALLSGCSSSTPRSATSPSSPRVVSTPPYLPFSAFRPLGAAGCRPASPVKRSPVGREVAATGGGGKVWGLLFKDVPFTAGQSVRIFWRVSGTTSLHLQGRGPSGAVAKLTSFERHSGSNWRRPGVEWGSELLFQQPGCWDIHLSGGKVSGDVWVMVK